MYLMWQRLMGWANSRKCCLSNRRHRCCFLSHDFLKSPKHGEYDQRNVFTEPFVCNLAYHDICTVIELDFSFDFKCPSYYEYYQDNQHMFFFDGISSVLETWHGVTLWDGLDQQSAFISPGHFMHSVANGAIITYKLFYKINIYFMTTAPLSPV